MNNILNFVKLFRPRSEPRKYRVEIITTIEQKNIIEVMANDACEATTKAIELCDIDNPDKIETVCKRLEKVREIKE